MLDPDDATPVDPPALTLEQRLDRLKLQQRRALRANRLVIEALWRIEGELVHALRPAWYVRLWRLLRRRLYAG